MSDGKVFTCNVCNQIIKSGSDLKDHLHQDTNAELPMDQMQLGTMVPELMVPEELGSIETNKGKKIEITFRNRQVRLVHGSDFSKGQLFNQKFFKIVGILKYYSCEKRDLYFRWCWHLLILSHCIRPKEDISLVLTSFNIHSGCYNTCGWHPHTLYSFFCKESSFE